MSLKSSIVSCLNLTLTLTVTGWLFTACSKSQEGYPEKLEKAMFLFYMENNNDTVLKLLTDLPESSLTETEKQLTTIFKAAAICEKGKPDSAAILLDGLSLRNLSEKNHYYYNSIRGLILFRQFKPHKAYPTLLALNNQQAPDIRALALAQRTLGRIMYNYGDDKNAIDWLLQSRRNFEKAALEKSVAVNNKFIGDVSLRLNRYDEAVPFLKSAVSTFIKYNDGAELFYVYVVLVDMYIRQNRLDSAEYYAQKAFSAYDISGDKTMQALLYNNRGEIEKQKGNYAGAVALFDSTLLLGADYYYSIARRQTAYLNLAEVYNNMKLPEKAREYALAAMNTITGNQKNNLNYKIYNELAKSYANTDISRMQTYQDSAVFYLKSYQYAQSVDLIGFYNSQEELHQSQHRIEELRSTARKHRAIYLIVAFFLLVIITALARIYQVQKSRNKALRELVQKNLKLLEKERKLNEGEWEKQKLTKRNTKSATDDERSKTIYTHFIHWLGEEGNFRRGDITLEAAAKELNTNREYLSRAINDQNKHFTELVNKYRVMEVIRVFSTPDDARNKLTLQVLATEVGFNSNSVFIDAFRKVTGMTPTQFREHLSENSTQPTN